MIDCEKGSSIEGITRLAWKAISSDNWVKGDSVGSNSGEIP